MLVSTYKDLGEVKLPEWQGRQKYMMSFDPANPVLEEGFEDYLEPVIQLINAAGVTSDTVHMTVDEKIVPPGFSQRRPGAHVDGCFMPVGQFWGHPSPGPGGWLHYCNALPVERMAVIVASSVEGCKVYGGEFEGEPMNDGDLEHIRSQLGEGELLPANRGFKLSPDCVHESMRFDVPTKRTFLRIAFKDSYMR